MSKQVSGGQDLGIGNLSGGQKHDPAAKRFKGEKGKEKMKGGGGEKVVGHRATTRSISYVKRSLEAYQPAMEFKRFQDWARENKKEYNTVAELCASFKMWRETNTKGVQVNVKNSRELKRLA